MFIEFMAVTPKELGAFYLGCVAKTTLVQTYPNSLDAIWYRLCDLFATPKP
jgi:hypothetical protein